MSTKPLGIDWDKQPLGQMTDGELAKRLNCSGSSVYLARASRGIPAFKRGAAPAAPAAPVKPVVVTGFTFTAHVQERYRQKFPGRCSGVSQEGLLKKMGAELMKAREMGELIRDEEMRRKINEWNHEKQKRQGKAPDHHFYGVDDAGPNDGAAFNDFSLTRRLLNHRPIYVVAEDGYTVITVLKMAEFMNSINYGLNAVTTPKLEPLPSPVSNAEALQHRPFATYTFNAPALAAALTPAAPAAPAAPAEDAEFRPLPQELLDQVELVSANSGIDRFQVLELLVKRGLNDLRKVHPAFFTPVPMRSLLEQWAE